MSDVIFNEPRISQKERMGMRETSSFANWLIKVGVAKTEKEAILILLGFAIIAIIVSLFLFFRGSGQDFISNEEALRETPVSGLRQDAGGL